ncbi:MAG: hypothetical protein IJK78_06705 [Bacteroidales bacterium]|nr:hypothetical protein [Bacteroidales bacterium]
MRVIITDFAKNQIRETAKYIQKEFGKISKDNFMKNVQLTRNLIGTNPYLGILEPLLENEPGNNRSIVVNSFNKLVYHIVDDHIEVSAFWDMRREPDSLIGQIISEQ